MLTILCTLFFLHNAMSCTDSHMSRIEDTQQSLSQTVCYCNVGHVLPKAVFFFEVATKTFNGYILGQIIF